MRGLEPGRPCSYGGVEALSEWDGFFGRTRVSRRNRPFACYRIGCPYESAVPLSTGGNLRIDQELLGDWTIHTDGNSDDAEL